MGMVKRQLRLREHGLRKFTVGERCNLQFEPKLLNSYEAEKEIRENSMGTQIRRLLDLVGRSLCLLNHFVKLPAQSSVEGFAGNAFSDLDQIGSFW
jgi:hypothetical protein